VAVGVPMVDHLPRSRSALLVSRLIIHTPWMFKAVITCTVFFSLESSRLTVESIMLDQATPIQCLQKVVGYPGRKRHQTPTSAV